jgi:hypothetical protein
MYESETKNVEVEKNFQCFFFRMESQEKSMIFMKNSSSGGQEKMMMMIINIIICLRQRVSECVCAILFNYFSFFLSV